MKPSPRQAVGAHVAFEVDRFDDASSQGWSVLVRGPVNAATDPGAVRLLDERARGSRAGAA